MRLSVLVPTYRRPESLARCLEGLRAQTRPAEEVLIVIRIGDEVSKRLLAEWGGWPELRVLECACGGQVRQMNAGLDVLLGDVVAITDDDAVPRPDWLYRIERHFLERPRLGGVGGRDFVEEDGVKLTGKATLVGTVQWFGRVAGNHHLGLRLLERVDCLKGANMSYRMAAVRDVRFDLDLRGAGAQTCNDWAFSLAIQKRGWNLLYDPAIAVDHYPATRFDPDQRKEPTAQAIEDSSFNVYLSLFRHMRPGFRRRAALTWAWLIGIKNSPGCLRGCLSYLKRDPAGMQKREAAKRAWAAVKRLHQSDYSSDRTTPTSRST